MARKQKSYDNEFKAQAVKLAQQIGGHKAAKELGIPDGTIYCWIKAFKEGRLSANEAVHSPKAALSLNDELIELRKRVKEQDKEIRRLKEENEFLEEASAFFAASRRKSAKKRFLTIKYVIYFLNTFRRFYLKIGIAYYKIRVFISIIS